MHLREEDRRGRKSGDLARAARSRAVITPFRRAIDGFHPTSSFSPFYFPLNSPGPRLHEPIGRSNKVEILISAPLRASSPCIFPNRISVNLPKIASERVKARESCLLAGFCSGSFRRFSILCLTRESRNRQKLRGFIAALHQSRNLVS